LDKLYESCIENGLFIEKFWDMTYKEISDYINAYKNKSETESREKATLTYIYGQLMGFAFHNPKAYPKITDIFPDLFTEEQQKPQDWRIMKERIMYYGELKKGIKNLNSS
jgi:hypothetical protein